MRFCIRTLITIEKLRRMHNLLGKRQKDTFIQKYMFLNGSFVNTQTQ
jgi:hypothetical protein